MGGKPEGAGIAVADAVATVVSATAAACIIAYSRHPNTICYKHTSHARVCTCHAEQMAQHPVQYARTCTWHALHIAPPTTSCRTTCPEVGSCGSLSLSLSQLTTRRGGRVEVTERGNTRPPHSQAPQPPCTGRLTPASPQPHPSTPAARHTPPQVSRCCDSLLHCTTLAPTCAPQPQHPQAAQTGKRPQGSTSTQPSLQITTF